MTTTPSQNDLLTLQKRSRRRLVGAIVLVLGSIIVLWNVLDDKPPQHLVKVKQVQLISRLPRDNVTAVSSSQQQAVLVESASAPNQDLPTQHVIKPLVASETVAATEATEQPKRESRQIHPSVDTALLGIKSTSPAKDPKRILEGLDDVRTSPRVTETRSEEIKSEQATSYYFIQVAAYADLEKAQYVIAKLKAAGVRVNSEMVNKNGQKIARIRVGPYNVKSDAEAALRKIQAQGVDGMLISMK